MTAHTNALSNTWSPIISGLDEDELNCVMELAIARLNNAFGKPCSLVIDNNPSGTMPASAGPAKARFPGKRWLRVVDQIDPTKKGGFAIIGSYTHASRIDSVPDGKLIVVSERKDGVHRVAVVKRTASPPPTCDVFGDASFMLTGVSFVIRSDGSSIKTSAGQVGGYHSGLDAGTPTQFHGTPWATIIALLRALGVPTL